MENTKVGPFQIYERLGNRRQRVFRARQIEQDLEVALKFLGMPKQAKRPAAIKKIKIEVDVLKALSHPNLVRILGAGVVDDQIFFASELIEGESLTALTVRRGKFAPDQVIECGRQIANLFEYLHGQDIIHAKLTPDKILFCKDGTVKVTDLRLNRSRRKRWDSSRQRELDIAAYMAPEQFTEAATPKSDIYSLGVILYEMLTGKLPYAPDTLGRMTRRKMSEKAPPVASQLMSCPAWLDKIVCQMVAPDPRKRPHTAKAVILAMDELRSLDESRKSAVSQVSGAFNPLTAGADKSEANRLLGRKEPNKKSDLRSFFSTTALIAGLVGAIAIVVFTLLPVSSEKNLAKANLLMQSEEQSDWREARDHLNKIIAKGPGDPLYDQARTIYFESRRRTLVRQAEHGRVHSLQSENTQRFVKAVRLSVDGKLKMACEEFRQLVDAVDPTGDERHIHEESKRRWEQLCKEEVSDTPENEE